MVVIMASKTDQYSYGRKVAVCLGDNESTCPAKAVTNWINASGVSTGALFRSIKWSKVQEVRILG